MVASQAAVLTALNTQIEAMGEVVDTHFGVHPDAEIYASQPGLGVILAARVLGEFGDDPHRFADARSRKNYAGTAPITRASGKKKVVIARYVRNRRLADALQQWAFCSLRGSPGARAYYQVLRARNIGHQAALRQVANRLVGILHGCLKTGTGYDEHTAWGHQPAGRAHLAGGRSLRRAVRGRGVRGPNHESRRRPADDHGEPMAATNRASGLVLLL